MRWFNLCFLWLLFYACQSREATKENCLDWYVKSYQGHPPSAHLFKEKCQSPQLIPAFNCQLAFNKLVLGAKEKQLKEEFGKDVLRCFTEQELFKHLKN